MGPGTKSEADNMAKHSASSAVLVCMGIADITSGLRFWRTAKGGSPNDAIAKGSIHVGVQWGTSGHVL